MKITVLDGYTVNPGDNPWTPLADVGEVTFFDRSAPNEVWDRSVGADAIVVNKIQITDDLLARLPDLKLIAVTATGFDCVDVEAAKRHGVVVCNVPEYSTPSVAQFVFSLLLHLVHNVATHDQLIRQGEWQRRGDFSFWQTPLHELEGLTMGVFGWGRIGRRVGAIASAFGMNVLACSRTQQGGGEYAGFQWATGDQLFSESDVVSLHCPLTRETDQLVDADMLVRMKSSAYLLNTARGRLIVESDLADALVNDRLAGAGLDVSLSEPICDDSPLLSAPRCVLTPHIAWATLASRQRCLQVTVGNIAAFQAGSPRNRVN